MLAVIVISMLFANLPLAHVAGAGPETVDVDLPLLLALAAAVLGWLWATRAIARAHPRNPVPRWRTAAFVGGIGAVLVALQSPIDTWADDLFSVHMVQHLLLGFVAAPLFVLAGPVLVLLRFARASVRGRVLLPLLRSRAVGVVTHPVVTWTLFGVVMWAVHFSPLFELALESEPIHELEHLLLLASGYLYWLPAIGSEPMPARLGWSGRFLYLFLGMPVSSVLGLALVAQTDPLYPAYVTASGSAAALADQRLAGTVMWVGGDLIGIVLLGVVVWLWVQRESVRMRRHSHAPGA
jgi:putative copper resistance protein D